MWATANIWGGPSVLFAWTTDKSAQTDTRNGSGRSSLIEILHFLLGGKTDTKSIFRQPPLDEHRFAIVFDLAGRRVRVQRVGCDGVKRCHLLVNPAVTQRSQP